MEGKFVPSKWCMSGSAPKNPRGDKDIYLYLLMWFNRKLISDHRSLTFAVFRLRMQTNGATKRVSRAVGFQVTPPIDYTLEYVLRKHTAWLVSCPMDNLIMITEDETL